MKLVSILTCTILATTLFTGVAACSTGPGVEVELRDQQGLIHLDYGSFLHDGHTGLDSKQDYKSLSAGAQAIVDRLGVDPQEEYNRIKKESKCSQYSKQFVENLKLRADSWLELAQKAEQGLLPIANCDARAAAIFSWRALSLLGCEKLRLERRHEAYDSTAIIAAKYCLQYINSIQIVGEKVSWAWRGLRCLPLNFEYEMDHRSGQEIYHTALEISESIRGPIQKLQDPTELPYWGDGFGYRDSRYCDDFPLLAKKHDYLPAVVQFGVALTWRKIVQLNKHLGNGEAEAEAKVEAIRSFETLMYQYKMGLAFYKQRKLAYKHELKMLEGEIKKTEVAIQKLENQSEYNDSIFEETRLLSKKKIALQQKSEDKKKDLRAIPDMQSGIYECMSTAQRLLGSVRIVWDETGNNGDYSQAKPHFAKARKYAVKVAELHLALANKNESELSKQGKDLVFMDRGHTYAYDPIYDILKAANMYYHAGEYVKAIELANRAKNTYGKLVREVSL